MKITKDDLSKSERTKRHNEELHQDHLGAMQLKPVRTAAWMVDGVKAGTQKVKDRFEMKARQPDVETES